MYSFVCLSVHLSFRYIVHVSICPLYGTMDIPFLANRSDFDSQIKVLITSVAIFAILDCGMNVHKQCIKVVESDCKPDKKYVRRGKDPHWGSLLSLHRDVTNICILVLRKLKNQSMYNAGLERK